jgi:biotin-dependent carboxylase-like uncharacterized protein
LAGDVALRIIDTGWSTTVQDHGRRGFAAIGVPTAGPVDRPSHDLANRLVGNPVGAATFETCGGLVIEARTPLIVATSADGHRHTLRAGDRLTVTAPSDGVWGYLAVRGGLDVPPVLGSRSHDTLSGLGPPPLERGADIGVGDDPRTDLPADHAPPRRGEMPLHVWPGPRAEWFHGGPGALTGRSWVVQADISRVGVRLSAGPFDSTRERPAGVTASEGLVEGAVQITPSGEPIVMLANHPTTGGYPVIAVVDPADIAILAQAPPGSVVRFTLASNDR